MIYVKTEKAAISKSVNSNPINNESSRTMKGKLRRGRAAQRDAKLIPVFLSTCGPPSLSPACRLSERRAVVTKRWRNRAARSLSLALVLNFGNFNPKGNQQPENTNRKGILLIEYPRTRKSMAQIWSFSTNF